MRGKRPFVLPPDRLGPRHVREGGLREQAAHVARPPDRGRDRCCRSCDRRRQLLRLVVLWWPAQDDVVAVVDLVLLQLCLLWRAPHDHRDVRDPRRRHLRPRREPHGDLVSNAMNNNDQQLDIGVLEKNLKDLERSI